MSVHALKSSVVQPKLKLPVLQVAKIDMSNRSLDFYQSGGSLVIPVICSWKTVMNDDKVSWAEQILTVVREICI